MVKTARIQVPFDWSGLSELLQSAPRCAYCARESGSDAGLLTKLLTQGLGKVEPLSFRDVACFGMKVVDLTPWQEIAVIWKTP